MALLFVSPVDDPEAWRQALARELPELDFRVYPEIGDPADIEVALVWQPPPGLLAQLPNLRLIQALSAGVDGLLADPTLPPVPLCRMVDESLTRTMAEYVLAQALFYHRDLDLFEEQQRRAEWRFRMPRPAAERTVGVMGLGAVGSAVARTLADAGFRVCGYSRSRHRIEGVETFAGSAERDAFLRKSEVLVCLLPLTAETRGILDRRLFSTLPAGAVLVHVGRGPQLVESDLLAMLACGQLRGAVLDVFATEPLPSDHPFWRHPRIRITPHVAGYSLPATGAAVVAANIRRLRDGRPLLHLVQRERGY
ncbi:Glyoxylate/hydroxypyruvate reductase A [bacterium HR40]|nr:Glyoxylate/hydroxypyruvate reductase A [bacterium HR40]